MADELIDIVSENGEVISQCMKSEAHATGLLHRTVLAEIIDSAGNWTLVKQASDRQDPGKYVSPVGGHIAAGESITDALKREAREEAGIDAARYTYKGSYIYNRYVNGRQENHYFIVFEIYSDETPTLNEESVSYKKFAPRELREAYTSQPEIFGDSFHSVVERLYPFLRNIEND